MKVLWGFIMLLSLSHCDRQAVSITKQGSASSGAAANSAADANKGTSSLSSVSTPAGSAQKITAILKQIHGTTTSSVKDIATSSDVVAAINWLKVHGSGDINLDFEGATVGVGASSSPIRIDSKDFNGKSIKISNLSVMCKGFPGFKVDPAPYSEPDTACFSVRTAFEDFSTTLISGKTYESCPRNTQKHVTPLYPAFDLTSSDGTSKFRSLIFDSVQIVGSFGNMTTTNGVTSATGSCEGVILNGNYNSATFEKFHSDGTNRFSIADLKEGGGTLTVNESEILSNVVDDA